MDTDGCLPCAHFFASEMGPLALAGEPDPTLGAPGVSTCPSQAMMPILGDTGVGWLMGVLGEGASYFPKADQFEKISEFFWDKTVHFLYIRNEKWVAIKSISSYLQDVGDSSWGSHHRIKEKATESCAHLLKARGEGDDRGWDGWMASLTQWTWVWVGTRNWWWTGRPGVLQSMGSQRVRHDWVTEFKLCSPEPWVKLSMTLCISWTHLLSNLSQG